MPGERANEVSSEANREKSGKRKRKAGLIREDGSVF